jgi:glycosyltransferase involved in cell wall biosynthesis
MNKPVVVHYHYPIWGTWKETASDRELGFLGCWRRSLRVYWNHGKGWRHTGKFRSYFMSHLGRSILRVVLCRMADARITCSEFLRNDTKIPWPVSVIPNGFNFDGLARWRERPFPTSAHFCFIGRVTPQKGLPCLLDAAALLKAENIPIHVHDIGDGDGLRDSIRQAEELEIEDDVTFHGRLAWDATLTILSDCAVLVIPSDYDEAAGYVVTEAYALKRAVIGSHRGGIPEQIGPGLIFQSKDHQELADKMRMLAKDLSYAQELGEKGYQFALERTGHVNGLLEIYRKLVKRTD